MSETTCTGKEMGLKVLAHKSDTKPYDVVIDTEDQIWGRDTSAESWYLPSDDGYYDWDDMTHPIYLLQRVDGRSDKRVLRVSTLSNEDVSEALASVVASMQRVSNG